MRCDRYKLVNALNAAAAFYTECLDTAQSDRLKDQFRDQRQDAERLAIQLLMNDTVELTD